MAKQTLPTVHSWEDAFDKFGYGDGDGEVETPAVAAILEANGYTVKTELWPMHNTLITSIVRDGTELIPSTVTIGYDDPRDFLPKDVIAVLDGQHEHSPEKDAAAQQLFQKKREAIESILTHSHTPEEPPHAPAESTAAPSKASVHQQVTDKIIAALEAGASGDQFEMPWRKMGPQGGIPINANTGNPYRGINVISLWADAAERGYPTLEFASYKQWQEIGAQVRKGEKACTVVFYKELEIKEKDAQGEDTDELRTILMARASSVFNAAQVDGYTPKQTAPPLPLMERLEHVERFITNTGAIIRHGGNEAFYRRAVEGQDGDFIQLPPREHFKGSATLTAQEAYYGIALHELGHWTGAAHRLNRNLENITAESKELAREELVAEISSAYLCAELKVTDAPRPDHAHYIASWITLLKEDNKAIFKAASQASKVSDYLNALQPEHTPEPMMRDAPEALELAAATLPQQYQVATFSLQERDQILDALKEANATLTDLSIDLDGHTEAHVAGVRLRVDEAIDIITPPAAQPYDYIQPPGRAQEMTDRKQARMSTSNDSTPKENTDRKLTRTGNSADREHRQRGSGDTGNDR